MRKLMYVVFFIFHCMLFYFFPLTNALVYVDIDQAFFKQKYKIVGNEKRKKNLHQFSYSKNMTNFEAFRWVIDLLFLKSGTVYPSKKAASNRSNITPINNFALFLYFRNHRRTSQGSYGNYRHFWIRC